MISLPTHLTLEHVFDRQRKIKSVSNKQPLKQPVEEDEEQQIEEMLKMTVSDEETFYDSEFVRIFCLVKINSLLAEQCNINKEFVDAFIQLYNSGNSMMIRQSKSDDQFFAQVMLQGQLFKYLHIENVQNILGGQCLLATSLTILTRETQKFLKKAQVTFALSFLSLSGRPQAFIPQVHLQKNHRGQVQFAQIVEEYIKIDDSEKYFRIQLQNRKVQDPYSMRCSPQVYGVVYQCLQFMKKDLDNVLNKFHFRTLTVKGEEYPNVDFSGDREVLKGDFLVCSLNEIGSMAYLRSERILNIYLGKNEVHKQNPKEVFELKTTLAKHIHLIAENRLISAPSNCDTMNIDNYQKDIYYNPFKIYQKFTKMMDNLYKIMLLEIQTALLGLKNVYNLGQGQMLLNDKIRNVVLKMSQELEGNRKQKLFFVRNQWNMEEE